MVKVTVYNSSKHDITLQGHSMIGTLQLVRSVTVAEVKESQGNGSNNQVLHHGGTEQSSMVEGTLPEVDLSNLTAQQQCLAKEVLQQESASFAVNDDDIGCIPELLIDITHR